MPRALLMLVLAMAGGVSSPAQPALRQVDLAKLRDPATANAEALRLLAARDGAEKYKYIIRDLRLHRVAPGSPDNQLAVVLIDYDLDFTDSDWFDGYKIENPDELFAAKWFHPVGPDGFHPPRLDALGSCSVISIDPAGREIDFPGNLKFVSEGYVFDFDRDGILDVADTGNYGSRNGGTAQVFHVHSLEAKPRLVFQAAYNWDLFPEAPWGFVCFDAAGDGKVEIAFGPKPRGKDAVTRVVTYRWDARNRGYQPDPSGGHPQVIPLPKGKLALLLAKVFEERLARETGSGATPDEPAFEAWKDKETVAPAPGPASAPGFQYHSLKDAEDQEILAFFNGRPPEDRFGRFGAPTEDQPPNHLPDGFWTLSPKAAALNLADANRSSRHRRIHRLAVDDRNGIEPPVSGWMVHHYRSPDCYSYQTHQFALRFGIDRPFLIHIAHSSNGIVFANPIEDRATHRVRVLNLSPEESRFMADTLFWLNQIRSRGGGDEHSAGSISSADGWATLTLTSDGSPPQTIADDTIWNTSTISSAWTEDYEPVTFLNLAEFLLANAWPEHLGERWAPKGGDDAANRDQLASFATMAFHIHERHPLPAGLLLDLVRAVGDEGLNTLMEPIQAIAAALPPPDDEDHEFEKLQIRFAQDHFGNFPQGAPDKEGNDWKRYQTLQEKRAHQPGPLLRKATAHALRQLRAVDHPKLLMDWAQSDDHGSSWALQRLEHHHPDAHADVLTEVFEGAGEHEQRQIFATLAKCHPGVTLRLRDSLSQKELKSLLLDVVRFELEADPARVPARVPALFALVDSTGNDPDGSRNTAVQLLERIPLEDDDQARLDRILLATFEEEPDHGPTPSLHLSIAIDILANRPDAAQYWDLFVKTGARVTNYNDFWAIRRAILRLTPDQPDKRKQGLEPLVRQRLKSGDGFMNDVFLTALAHDLTGLRDDLQFMATSSREDGDGECADSAGGNFTSPQGQRYHLAREVLAIWSETDPATRARMWCALVVNHTSNFDDSHRPTASRAILKQRAEDAIKALSPEQRTATIGSMLALAEQRALVSPATAEWLQQLAPPRCEQDYTKSSAVTERFSREPRIMAWSTTRIGSPSKR